MEMGQDNVDEEADDIYNGILGEIGLEYQMEGPVINLFLSNLDCCKRENCTKKGSRRGRKERSCG